MPDAPGPRPLPPRARSAPAGEIEHFVAIDLETTGLDPLGDRIIEIGATRFDRSGAIDHFTTLVDPGRPIPPVVQTLTGLTDADLAGAPTITRVGAELAAYAGRRTVVGQNISFDLSFLAASGIELQGAVYDTWELAALLLPGDSRLGLGALAAELDIAMPVAHRALADAEATRDVFLALLDRIEALPATLLLDLLTIAQSAEWPIAPLLQSALVTAGEAATGHGVSPSGDALANLAIASQQRAAPPPLVRVESPSAVEPSEIEQLFARAARHPELLPGYERRAGQEQMAQAVARAIGESGQLAVEAGTGTGKSLAYLLPALLHALRSGERVVVSTYTLNLQEQLARHDVPIAAALVEEHAGAAPGTLRSAVLKGRSNYLCLERWAEARHRATPRSLTEARLHARAAVWLQRTQSGDRADLRVRGEEQAAWAAISADSNDCLARRCQYVREGSCFLLRARQQAAAAHVVIVNHALLLANAAAGDQVLPPFRHVVIDEAHRMEDVATQSYGAALSCRELASQLEELASAGGVAGRMRSSAQLDPSPLSPAAGLTAAAESVQTAARAAAGRVPLLEQTLRSYAEEHRDALTDRGRPGGGADERDVSLGPGRRSQPQWADVEESAIQLDVTLLELSRRLGAARDIVGSLPQGAAPGIDGLAANLGRSAVSIDAARTTVDAVALRADRDTIAWLTPSKGDLRMQVAPLSVAERLSSDVYAARDSVVATSATLTAGVDFSLAEDQLGLVEPETLQIPSPFDFRRSVLVLIPTDVPEPESPGHRDAMHEALVEATSAAEGRTLALFTSHAALRQAAGAISGRLGRRDIGVFAQGVDGPPERLLRTLAERPRSLLLGTAAFWEGIDVRGEALSQIAIARLPFPVPADPIHAGRAAQYDEPFEQYMLPQAILRFRQGFGRLIRGSTERGVCIVLDRRIASRRYGEAFLDALPDCEVRRLPSAGVAPAVRAWLAT